MRKKPDAVYPVFAKYRLCYCLIITRIALLHSRQLVAPEECKKGRELKSFKICVCSTNRNTGNDY